jgi:hypothetical protein
MKVACLVAFAIMELWPLAACQNRQSPPRDAAIPAWLGKFVSGSGPTPPVIERALYEGQPAFELTATDRADTGDEHSLYSAGGTLICRFGGYTARVTSGSCDLNKIVYVGTVYDPKRR